MQRIPLPRRLPSALVALLRLQPVEHHGSAGVNNVNVIVERQPFLKQSRVSVAGRYRFDKPHVNRRVHAHQLVVRALPCALARLNQRGRGLGLHVTAKGKRRSQLVEVQHQRVTRRVLRHIGTLTGARRADNRVDSRAVTG